MPNQLGRLAIVAAILMGGGCGRAPDSIASVEMDALKTLINQSSNRYLGTRTISIRILPALEGSYAQGQVQYAVQAAHRWVEADIHRYEVTLKLKDPKGSFVDLPDGRAVVLMDPRIAQNVVFAKLDHGKTYQVALRALGNLGGTASETLLNRLSPTVAEFNFPATGKETRHQGANMQAALDPTPIDPAGELGFLPPPDGEYQNVSETVSSEVY
jgi:hypothetical protein